MNSLKSISSGVSFIFIASMLLQLGYIFVVVGYNSVAKNYPFLKGIDWIFQYLLTMPIVILIMFFGGYLAAAIAKYKVIIHSFLVGFITLVVMMWMALQNAQLTSKGLIINLLMLLASTAGGYYWRKKNTGLAGKPSALL